MPKELQELTDGTYTLAQTKVENQFLFFRNDHQVLGNVGANSVVELLAQYYIEKDQKGELRGEGYECKIDFIISNYEISRDHTIIRLTVSNNPKRKTNLRIVKGGEKKSSSVAKQRPSFFKRVTRNLFGKG